MMKKLFCLISVLFAVMACVSRLETEDEGPRSGMDPSLVGKPVTITFGIPDVNIASPSTKGVDGEDGSISDDPYLDPDKLFLVVCGTSQSIKYIRKAEVVIDQNTGLPKQDIVNTSDIPGYPLADGDPTVIMYSFTVQLELSDVARTIYFLGNIDETKLNTGARAYEALPNLLSYEGKQAYWQSVYVSSIDAKMDDNDQPEMSGHSYLPDDATRDRLKCVPLIRNYAKIQVTNATAEEDEFELFSYAVINSPTQGTVAPFRNNKGNDLAFDFRTSSTPKGYLFSGYETCNFETLDQTLEYPGYISPASGYDGSIPTASEFLNPDDKRVIRYEDNSSKGIYLYERGIPSDSDPTPTFVIICGRFGNTGDYYYYRLDLMESKIVNLESVYQYYPLYRNFRYNIEIRRISSMGLSTPEAAANASGAEDISADISMKHLSDISNGQTRLVVEPFMSRTYTGPNEEGYYYLYARFYDDLNSSEPNTVWGSVSVELEPMDDNSDDILILYDDVGNAVQSFYPNSQEMGGDVGFRIIRFNTKTPGNVTRTQKIKITGRNLYTHEDYPLYREVEISLQQKQSMTVSCSYPELPLNKGEKQDVLVSIPAGMPSSMFPLEFIIEAQDNSLTPDNKAADNNNLPVTSGISISEDPDYVGKRTIQFIRTLTLEEYNSLPVKDGQCTFISRFKTSRSDSATTVWVANDYFIKGHVTFGNLASLSGHFWVYAEEDCCVRIVNGDKLEYRMNDEGWNTYPSGKEILLDRGNKVSFRTVQNATVNGWGGSTNEKFFCYQRTSNNTSRDGEFSLGGNIASLIIGDNFLTGGATYSGDWSFYNLFQGHTNLINTEELILPMLTCKNNGYKNMFKGCTSLITVPQLPATTLATSCYESMFEGCTSLADIPDDYLSSAGGLATNCYKAMFKNTGLTAFPTLDATTLAESCYYSMFAGCASLSTSSTPVYLPASTLVANCYRDMFNGASLVNEVICLATDISASECTTNWLKNVATSGAFWKVSGMEWGTGPSAIPTSWIIKEYAAPVFPGPPFDEEIDL